MLVLISYTDCVKAASTDYILDETRQIPIPSTYILQDTIYSMSTTGDESEHLKGAEDIYINDQGYLFVADSGNDRILKLTKEGKLAGIFKEADGIGFNDPQGVFADDEGNMYIADTGNGRIVHLSANGEFVETFIKPESELISSQFFTFEPSKISVSPTGYIYVLKDDSILTMDAYNRFRGYLGQSEIGFNLVDMLIRKLASQQQKQLIENRSAPSFTNMFIDKNGIIYAATLDIKGGEIKKLNAIGENIYEKYAISNPFIEAMKFLTTMSIADKSIIFGERTDDLGKPIKPKFSDITSDENGIITVVEQNTGKVYQYDQEGNLLLVFGGKGDQKGRFNLPVSIEGDQEGNIYILDSVLNNIQIFAPTAFIRLVHNALRLYNNGEYDEARAVWEEVLKIDGNYQLAHKGIAKAFYKQKLWQKSMEEFIQADDREGYSKAYSKYRHDLFRKYFLFVVLGIILIFMIILKTIVRMKRTGEKTLEFLGKNEVGRMSLANYIKLVPGVLFHPVETFEIIKINREKINPVFNLIILLLAVAARIFYIYTVHYPLADINPRDSNIWLEMIRILLPVITWLFASFSITSIMDGESTIGEIFTSTSLCIVPYIIINIPLAIFSNILSRNELGLYALISNGAMIWVFLLLFISIMTMNNYKIFRTFLTSLMSIVLMLLIWSITLILFVFSNQLFEFMLGLIREIQMMLL